MEHRVAIDDTTAAPPAKLRDARHARPDTALTGRATTVAPGTVGAAARDDPLSAQLRVAVAQRAVDQTATTGPAVALEGAVHQPIIQRNGTSADLLTELATPTIKPGPEVPVQKALVDKLDVEHEAEFRGAGLNLGGILIEEPGSYEELVEQAQLTALPKMVGGSPYRYMSFGISRAAKIKELGFERLLIKNTLATMKDARQLEYLQLAGLPNDEWKILIELHYFRERDMSATGFHKDTLGQTLFVNLNYHMGDYLGEGEMLIGPEIVVNPPVSPTHKAQTKATLPKRFRQDLKATRGALGEPTEIKTELVDPYGYVAFVDEAVHHATPLYGHRFVTPAELEAYLGETYPDAFREAKRAYSKFAGQILGSWWHYTFASYVNTSIIAQREIPAWQTWMEIVSADDDQRRLTRNDLKATMSDDSFDDLLEFAGKTKLGGQRAAGRAAGFYSASIPGAGLGVSTHEFPIAKRPVLKRTLSNPDFRATLPPEPAAHVKRRFFRTWIRAIPKDMADELPRRLQAEAQKEREVEAAQAAAEKKAQVQTISS